jgi:hypothetical protein
METRYLIEINGSIEELAYEVNSRIYEGFEPAGGFFVREYEVNGMVNRVFYQPMFKPVPAQESSLEADAPASPPSHS